MPGGSGQESQFRQFDSGLANFAVVIIQVIYTRRTCTRPEGGRVAVVSLAPGLLLVPEGIPC